MIGAAFLCAAATGAFSTGASGAEPLSGPPPGPGVEAAPAPRRAAGIVMRGDDRLVGAEPAAREVLPGGQVSLNLVEVPLPVAAKAVLADTMGWGYTLDAEANGTVTLQPAAR